MNKKPKSATSTYHRSYNYGATLQAYALQKTLISIGFDNKIIDFYRDPFEKGPFFSGNIRKDLKRLLLRLYDFKYRKEKKQRILGFDTFTDRYLKLTKKYNSLEELENDPPIADCYITGSDQVLTVREPRFVVERNLLTFAKNLPKYSYAASLACYDFSDDEKLYFQNAISHFNTLSVRENASVKYLKTFCQNNIRVDIDPVFLIDKLDWENIIEKPNNCEKYILYFQVNSNPIANSILQRLKKQYHLPIVCLQTNPFVRVQADKVVLDASPEAFLGWVHDAEIVVTTSFHGTAFSIIFGRNFYSLTKENSNPIRIQNLLLELGLQNRLISCFDQINNVESIDWMSVLSKLKYKRQYSLDYLKSIYNQIIR